MSENIENLNVTETLPAEEQVAQEVAEPAVEAVEAAPEAAVEAVEAAPEAKPAKKGSKFVANLREFFRKLLVGLKRTPQNIALVMYVAALLVYTLNQTKISNTTATIQRNPMGLCSFVALLSSILGFVCFFNSFPKRQKPRIVMLLLFSAMMVAVVVCDIVYYNNLAIGIEKRLAEMTTAAQMGEFYKKFDYYFKVQNVLIAHIVLVALSVLLTLLSPLIGKLLRKINTSVDVDDNGDMAEIEREDDEE